MSAYYNEIDPYAADWLRNLIKAGHIADGVVDTRSISDIHPEDLREFTQCHFFAGIGVWSRALRLAQWADTRRVWTGSCPCQPFSVAGSGAGVLDERHLWPHWFWLIEQCQPDVVFGEQVEAAIRHGWLDLVQSDMEGVGYAFAPVGLPAAGVGAPHIRQRLWFVAERLADTGHQRHERSAGDGREAQRGLEYASGYGGLADTDGGDTQQFEGQWARPGDSQGGRALGGAAGCGDAGGLDHHHHQGLEGHGRGHCAEIGQRQGQVRPVAEAGESGRVADDDGDRRSARGEVRPLCEEHDAEHGGAISWVADTPPRGLGIDGGAPWPSGHPALIDAVVALADPSGGRVPQAGRGEVGGTGQSGVGEEHRRPGPTNGHWGSADWIFCRDGKWRPIEPGTFPLAHGATARVGRLRAYGNAIVAQVAAEVISAYMEVSA